MYSRTGLIARDLNTLILDYLLLEGFPDAAAEFARETGLPTDVDHVMIQERMEIRNAVEDGRVEEAVRRVNELDPEVSFLTITGRSRVIQPQDKQCSPRIKQSCTTLSPPCVAMRKQPDITDLI